MRSLLIVASTALLVLSGCQTLTTRSHETPSSATDTANNDYNRGNVLAKEGNYASAIECYSNAIAGNPRLAEAFSNRGLARYFVGQSESAIADFDQAITLSPAFATAYSNRGLVYCETGKYDLAIADCTRAIELDPKLSKAYYNRGKSYGMTGHYDECIRDCSEAIIIDPKYTGAFECRAMAWYYKKDYVKAKADVRASQQLGGSPSPRFIKALGDAMGN